MHSSLNHNARSTSTSSLVLLATFQIRHCYSDLCVQLNTFFKINQFFFLNIGTSCKPPETPPEKPPDITPEATPEAEKPPDKAAKHIWFANGSGVAGKLKALKI